MQVIKCETLPGQLWRFVSSPVPLRGNVIPRVQQNDPLKDVYVFTLLVFLVGLCGSFLLGQF